MSIALCRLTEEYEKYCGYDGYKHIPFDGEIGRAFRCTFTLMDYFPLILTIGKMVVGAIIGAVSLYIAGVALFVDLVVNYILQSIIKQEGPYPCLVYDEYQMPALASQTVAFFITGFLLFCIVYRREIGTYLLWLVYVLGYAAVYKRVFDGINTPEQLIVGAVVGFVDALLMHAVVYYLLYSYIPWICETKLAKQLHANNYSFRSDRPLDLRDKEWYSAYERDGYAYTNASIREREMHGELLVSAR